MKTSKPTKLGALIAVGMSALSLSAIAAPALTSNPNGSFNAAETAPTQPGGNGGKAGGRKGGKGSMSPTKRLEELAAALSLTDDQKTQIKPIITDAMKQIREVRKDTTLTPEQKRPKVQDIVTATRAMIDPILTPEQRAKFADMKDFMGGPKKGGKGGKGGKRGGKKGGQAPAAAPAG